MRKLGVLLSVFMCLSFLIIGCSNGSTSTGGSGVTAVSMFGVPPANLQDLPTNWFTKYVEDKFGINISWVTAQGTDDAKTKQQLLLASGNYPDVFMAGTFTQSQLQQYGKQKVLLPLNDLIKQYAPNIQKAMDSNPALKQAMIAPDGNIYGIYQVNECYHCTYNFKYWINSDWLGKLGLQMPKTTTDFENVLKAMKTGNPNKDGQPVIPLTGAFETAKPATDLTTFLMNAFIYDDPSNHYFVLKDNKVQLAAVQPEWKQGLQYMNKLYSEGLIDQAAFTQTSDVVKREIAQNPSTIGVVPYANNTFLNITDKDMRWVNWVAVPPLIGPNGASYAQWQPGGVSATACFAITNKASKDAQIKAIKLADYLYTYEGTLLAVYGQQDKFWKAAASSDLGVNGQPAKYWVDDTSFFAAGNVQNSGWDQMGPVYQSTEFRQSEAQNQDPNTVAGGIQRRLYLETLNKYKGHGPQNQYPRQIYLDPANVDKANQLTQQINDYIKQNAAAFVTGQKSLDKDWDSYVQGLTNLGLSDYLKIYQDALNQDKTPTTNFPDPFGA